jgi:sulfite exporter TauE/SafE
MPAEASPAIAFMLGIFSTLHCWGMCGGIISALSLAVPARAEGGRGREWLMLACYNIGRISSYGIAGVLTAAAGFIFSSATGHAGHAVLQTLSGLILVLLGLRVAGWFAGLSLLEKAGARLWRWLQPLARPFLPMDRAYKAVIIGAVWGWLPCGLVYSVLLWAATSADPLNGGITMLAFGLGTLPGMISAGLLAGRLPAVLRLPLLRKIAGTVLLLLGLAVLSAPYLFSEMAPTGHHGSMPQQGGQTD